MSSDPNTDLQGYQVMQFRGVTFADPRPDVHLARQPIAGCAWVDTDEGVVLFDTLMSKAAARATLERIHQISGRVRYIVYTHGHLDHVSGAPVFMADNPEIIANALLPERLDGYRMLAEHRARITAIQFNVPEVVRRGEDYVYPTKTFQGELIFSLGGKTFECRTARAETDDVCWAWVPEIKTAFIGDLIIGSFPNIGNPWKPTRFALPWARTLEAVRAKEPELILCNGGALAYEGRTALEVLDANIEAIHALHDQVVNFINQDMHITEMIHAVKLPDHLKDNPYLRFTYSRPEFFVYNVYRWYHGYFDHNPAHLLPRPRKEVAAEIHRLIGDANKILGRARTLLEQGQAQLALEVLDTLLTADEENLEARELRIRILEVLGSEDYCLMSRNTWVYFIDRDKAFLKARGRG
jgi:alkyl sulfatase BDS1-like metallo-beta-lactamase superfamily hydrolase